MEFEVSVQETDYNYVDREILGWKWWWQIKPEGRWVGSECGFARSERRAHKAARKAAEKMAARRPVERPTRSYTLEVES